MLFHYDSFAGIDVPLSEKYHHGKYGRLFPFLPVVAKDSDRIRKKFIKLAKEMVVKDKGPSELPAGYTYLGQFISHDITFDPTSIAERQIDPKHLTNFRTPALDLDSVYGSGPLVSSVFYQAVKSRIRTEFLVDSVYNGADPEFFDVPRIASIKIKNGRTIIERKDAAIPDPRNDENLVLSQLHTAFLLLHNKFYQAELQKLNSDKELDRKTRLKLFFKAQKLVRWHFQWIVLYDYLPRIVGEKIVENLFDTTNVRIHDDWKNKPFIPLEFSVAAFRFGHSQVRGSYTLNNRVEDGTIFRRKRKSLEPKTFIDWSKFFGSGDTNKSRPINQTINDLLNPLPSIAVTSFKERNLPFRNIIKSFMLKLPSGQSIANKLCEDPLEITGEIGFPKEFSKNTPLWYYILYEADKQTGDQEGKLGPVGGRIVAEVLIGLIESDKNSFLNQDPGWKPKKLRRNPGIEYTMVDLLKDAGVYKGALAPKG